MTNVHEEHMRQMTLEIRQSLTVHWAQLGSVIVEY